MLDVVRTVPSSVRTRLPHSIERTARVAIGVPQYRALRRRRRDPQHRYSLVPYESANALFVHVPKTGGSSLGITLFGNVPGHLSLDAYRLLYSPRKLEALTSFAFVREPHDRLRSAYEYLRAGGGGGTELGVARRLQPYSSLDDFVLSALEDPGIRSLVHFREQSSFICRHGSDEIELDFIGRYETMGDDVARLCDLLGVAAVELPRLNRRPSGSSAAALTPAASRVVRELYARDFELFGYD